MNRHESSRVDPELRTHRPSPTTELPLFEQVSCGGVDTLGRFHERAHVGADAMAPEVGERQQDLPAGIQSETAHARRNDPPNSHEAAASVVNLGRTKDMILEILRNAGPCTDEGIIEAFYRRTYPAITASPSGIRSRRAWLVDHGFVRSVGTGKTQAGRACSIWGIAERGV